LKEKKTCFFLFIFFYSKSSCVPKVFSWLLPNKSAPVHEKHNWKTKPYGCCPTESAMYEDLEVCFPKKNWKKDPSLQRVWMVLSIVFYPIDDVSSWKHDIIS
jgi:hypothetical protein